MFFSFFLFDILLSCYFIHETFGLRTEYSYIYMAICALLEQKSPPFGRGVTIFTALVGEHRN